jgi:hypothetical protein
MIDYAHGSRILEMERMTINSKKSYRRDRVISGRGPHEMLNMIHQQMRERLANDQDDDIDRNMIDSEKLTEVEK